MMPSTLQELVNKDFKEVVRRVVAAQLAFEEGDYAQAARLLHGQNRALTDVHRWTRLWAYSGEYKTEGKS